MFPSKQIPDSYVLRDTQESRETKPIRNKKNLYKALLMAFLLPVFLYLIYISPVKQCLKEEHLKSWKESMPLWYIFIPLFFSAVSGISIALGTPRSLIAILAGSVFGFWLGLLLAELSSLIGAGIAYLYSRWARQTLLSSVMERFHKIQGYVEAHSFITVFLLRQMPVPGFLVNLFLGLLNVKAKIFFMASALGFLPQNIIFTLYGTGLKQDFVFNAGLASGFLILFSILFYLLYQRMDLAKNLLSQISSLKKTV